MSLSAASSIRRPCSVNELTGLEIQEQILRVQPQVGKSFCFPRAFVRSRAARRNSTTYESRMSKLQPPTLVGAGSGRRKSARTNVRGYSDVASWRASTISRSRIGTMNRRGLAWTRQRLGVRQASAALDRVRPRQIHSAGRPEDRRTPRPAALPTVHGEPPRFHDHASGP